jgi:NADH-quinone oxidoreductase subunit N
VIPRPAVDWFALSPMLALLGAASVALLAAVLVPARVRKPFAAIVTVLGYAGAGVAAGFVFDRSADGGPTIGDTIFRDRWGALAAVIIAGIGIVAVGISYGHGTRDEHVAEYYSLLAAAGSGMIFFVTSGNLMTLFLGLEWFSICLYILCAIDRDQEGSLEAGLKYLIVGGFGSAVLLFGSALVYGASGALDWGGIAAADSGDEMLVIGLAMVLAGFAFKTSAAPFHMWTPDVYEGAPTPVTAFMAAATKVAALVLTYRVLVTAFPGNDELWSVTIAVIAVASLAVGNLAALVQQNVKRMLAYSSISHAGFMLIPVAADSALGGRALLYYLIPYSAMSLGAFAVVAARERELGAPVTFDNLAGFGWERPFFGVAMWVFMLGFAGFPLTGGFLGKFYAFSAAYDRGWTWLVIVGVVATAVSLYYYLGVVRAMYFRTPGELRPVVAGGSPPRELILGLSVGACLAVTVGSFFVVQPLIDLARDASGSLPF